MLIEDFPVGADERVREWMINLREQHGEDCSAWPVVGCGAHNRIWSSPATADYETSQGAVGRPSQVVEVMRSNGEWYTFLAERVPHDSLTTIVWNSVKARDDNIGVEYAEMVNETADLLPEESPEPTVV